ncbi:valine--tRNA ligase [Pararhodobacter aggregans]|uniref:Valine--tRNA ligase n=1 Tax=Pararhodobacter aggregans TaxID=404875 RepID=A0A2T7UX75_9RHOB|nr:valine--tRNA ligase [Pararhodobacter aggregans]PTX05065.1 valyl-tRNA synthetase [Pararhodobacter aggregans]PVE49375.1 valine--tRNA ligase [Pararhodobacter aggregans]
MTMDKTFDATEAEARIARLWEERGAFRAGAGARRDETFCIMIPPPNVTGSLHIGHAFNNTLQDILVRWHRMRGFDTLWQPGQDHAGIATQLVVERELAKTNRRRTDFSRDEFTALVWEQKKKSGGTIIGQLQRLGCSLDWSRNAFTMSGAPNAPAGEEGNFHDAVIKVFVDLYTKGLIYRGQRLVNWDPHFETAISDLEVENTEVAGHMWHFKYPLAGGATYEYVERDEDGNVTKRETRNYISIATTRPETMLGDGAVAVHPSDERYKPIVGMLCEIPVGPKEHRRLIPIITDDYPDPTFGSGAVKITGAHDFNDYAVAQRNGIPLYNLMDTKARMRADGLSYEESATIAGAIARGEREAGDVSAINLVPEELRGLDRYDARKAVVAAINAEGLAVTVLKKSIDPETNAEHLEKVPLVEDKPIMQPFGDRSKVVIEPYLTWQWFVDTSKLVGPALDAVRKGCEADRAGGFDETAGYTRILPESGEKTYYHWLENIEPWCISRQLWWGHQIPVWYDEEGNQYCAPSEAEAQAMAPGRTLTRDPDVLDTWFSSGLWPIGTLGWPEETPELARYFPTDVLVTGQDILFFWVARMMMMQLAVVGEVPFHTVYLHGLVRDAKGKKMSKSVGNVIDPLEIIDEFGADALRFTNAAMASLGGVLKLDTQRITGYRNFTTKLWNATRFAEMNGVFEGAPVMGIPAATATANRWIIGETARTRAAVDEALASYRFNDAANALYAFVWGKVCDWYVEFAKPLFDGEQAAETKAVMRWVLDQCFVLLHPIMPFITEELWALTGPRETLCVHAPWPEYGPDLADAEADREMSWVIGLIEAIRSSRTQMRVPAGLKLPMLVVDEDATATRRYARNEALIERLARLDGLHRGAPVPRAALTVAAEGATYALPLEGVIDVKAEADRLGKGLEKLEKEIGGLKGRLDNPRFVANAAEEVVEEARATLAEKSDEAARLSEVLAKLRAMA